MTIQRYLLWHFAILILTGLCSVIVENKLQAQYSPEHPRVQAMVDLAAKYLAQVSVQQEYDGGKSVLIAYTLYKITGTRTSQTFAMESPQR